MNTTATETNNTPVILSRGVFELLKDLIKSKKLSKFNEAKLEQELKSAKQVLKNELPADVVTIDRTVTITELDSGVESTYHLVAPDKAKKKNNTLSIISLIGTALVGYPKGTELQWEMPEGLRTFRIEKVAELA